MSLTIKWQLVWKGEDTKGMNDGGNGLCCMTNNNFNQKVRTLQVIADLRDAFVADVVIFPQLVPSGEGNAGGACVR